MKFLVNFFLVGRFESVLAIRYITVGLRLFQNFVSKNLENNKHFKMRYKESAKFTLPNWKFQYSIHLDTTIGNMSKNVLRTTLGNARDIFETVTVVKLGEPLTALFSAAAFNFAKCFSLFCRSLAVNHSDRCWFAFSNFYYYNIIIRYM